AERHDLLRRRPIESVVEQHLQVLVRRAAVLVLGGQRVAAEQEDLLRMMEESRASRLTGGLLHVLEAERETLLAEEAPRELRRVDDHVALEVGMAAIQHPGLPGG